MKQTFYITSNKYHYLSTSQGVLCTSGVSVKQLNFHQVPSAGHKSSAKYSARCRRAVYSERTCCTTQALPLCLCSDTRQSLSLESFLHVSIRFDCGVFSLGKNKNETAMDRQSTQTGHTVAVVVTAMALFLVLHMCICSNNPHDTIGKVIAPHAPCFSPKLLCRFMTPFNVLDRHVCIVTVFDQSNLPLHQHGASICS